MKLTLLSENRSPKETTVYYDITNTVSNVCDKIRDQYQFGPDVQFFLSNIKGLDQDVSQTELQGNDPMQKYYPNGGQVSLEQDENPKNSEQGQGNFIIREWWSISLPQA